MEATPVAQGTTPAEAQAAYAAADDEFLAHARTCHVCGNSRLRYRPACSDGDPLRAAALARRQVWADAVAQVRASLAGLGSAP